MGFIRKRFRYVYFNAVFYLIVINAIIFAAQFLTRRSGIITAYLALNPAAIIGAGWYWQFITYMFAHDPYGITHILFNMLALYLFGVPLERYTGSREFLCYYLVSGILAGAASFVLFIFTGAYYVQLLGASGAIFAVQLAYAAFFPNNIIYIWGILPIRAPVMVLGFTALELFSGVFGFRSGTAHFTHLFGFAAGWLYFVVRWSANPWRLMFKRNKF